MFQLLPKIRRIVTFPSCIKIDQDSLRIPNEEIEAICVSMLHTQSM
jgi:hypothetical protein